ncbi:EthD family reductase [Phytohabitans sp. ZYX-F-186]|uniref:EthD family reductase n=1 Tax=Phytohabitans maris TaxID=3071409 RepID=A0ABU0ZKG7_9ACTN|nr:EthD family reductase [Phytohabitans sp. ZYX-F-186]MDQ7907546.1 EthD family reductase [Phytohabitans sp. ZYX-F-186]
MFSVMTFVRRRPEMSLEEFEHYWRSVHVPITLAHTAVKRYRIGIYRDTMGDGITQPWDGWAILTYESREAWEADEQSPESIASQQDVPKFLSALHAVVVDTTDYR